MEESENILITPETLSEIDPDWLSEVDCEHISWPSKMDDPQMSSTLKSFIDPQIEDLQGHGFYDFCFEDMKDLAEDCQRGLREEPSASLSDSAILGCDDKRSQADDFIRDKVFETKNNSSLDFDPDFATDEGFLTCDFLSNFLSDGAMQSDYTDYLPEDGLCSRKIEKDLSPHDGYMFHALDKVDGHEVSFSDTSHPFISDFDTEDMVKIFDGESHNVDFYAPEPAHNSDGLSPSDKSSTASMRYEQFQVSANLKTISTLPFNPLNLACSSSNILKSEMTDVVSNSEHQRSNVEFVDQTFKSERLNDMKEKSAFKEEIMPDNMSYQMEGDHSESCVSFINGYRFCWPDTEPHLSMWKRHAVDPLTLSSSHVLDLQPDMSCRNQILRSGESCDKGKISLESGVCFDYSLNKSTSLGVTSTTRPNVFFPRPDDSLSGACDEKIIFRESVEAVPWSFSCLDKTKGGTDFLPCDGLSHEQKSLIQSISGTSMAQPEGDDFSTSVDKAVDVLTHTNMYLKYDGGISAHNVEQFSDVNSKAFETVETSIQMSSIEQNQFTDPAIFVHQTSPNRDQNYDNATHILPVGSVKITHTLSKPAECTCPCVNVGMKDMFVCLRVRDMWNMNVKDMLLLAGHDDAIPKSEKEIAKEKLAERKMVLKNKEQRLLRRQ